MEIKIARHRNYGIGNASQNEFASRRLQLEEIMSDVERTQKDTKEVERENTQNQRMINVLQGGLQKIFENLAIEPDGVWDNQALLHKRGAVLHKIGMLEYRAFELTQANLAVLASQHQNPGSSNYVTKTKFEAPDLLLPSLQKPVFTKSSFAPAGTLSSSLGGETDEEADEEYGEEYDDTRTFTVKDFKEQALRYAKDHFQVGGPLGN